MTIEEIIKLDIEGKDVLIIGCPASGKSYLLKQIPTTTHLKISTDDYMNFGYEQSMYEVMKDIKASVINTLVEGIQGYRLLRKGIQLDCYYPDIVIELIISEQQMLDTYKHERDDKKIRYLKGFNKMHDKIITDYFALENKQKPEWFKVTNNR